MLDEDFMHAYEHGILVHCGDGITRRIYPRFFCFSTDYPERYVPSSTFADGPMVLTIVCRRVSLACIQQFARCICPLCHTLKSQIPELGTKPDMKRRAQDMRKDTPEHRATIDHARDLIFLEGNTVDGVRLESMLKPKSLTPAKVRHLDPMAVMCLNDPFRACSLPSWLPSASTTSRCLHPTSCMSSSWVCGGPTSCTSCAFCTHFLATASRFSTAGECACHRWAYCATNT